MALAEHKRSEGLGQVGWHHGSPQIRYAVGPDPPTKGSFDLSLRLRISLATVIGRIPQKSFPAD